MESTSYLPLSWDYGSQCNFSNIRLKDKKNFIYHAFLNDQVSAKTLWSLLKDNNPDGFILRGVSLAMAKSLSGFGASALGLGVEACINLNSFAPSVSLSSLHKRGIKKVEAYEQKIPDSHSLTERVIKNSKLNNKTRLRKLFQTTLTDKQRIFVSYNLKTKLPNAFITISRCGKNNWHIEQMVRSYNAPAGTMETLILKIIQTLKLEKHISLSLGEVPFCTKPDLSMTKTMQSILIGKASTLAPVFLKNISKNTYNIQGLYNFKNKFNPTWRPLYWIAYPNFTLKNFIDIGKITRVLR